jgi:hypothetical protein
MMWVEVDALDDAVLADNVGASNHVGSANSWGL